MWVLRIKSENYRRAARHLTTELSPESVIFKFKKSLFLREVDCWGNRTWTLAHILKASTPVDAQFL